MKTWVYKDKEYCALDSPTLQEYYDSSCKTFAEFFEGKNIDNIVIQTPELSDFKWIVEYPLTYSPRWNKCFWLTNLRYGGNGNKLKAYIEDVYVPKKRHWVEAKELRFVQQIDDRSCYDFLIYKDSSNATDLEIYNLTF